MSGISRRESGVFKIDWEYLNCFCEAINLPENEKQALVASAKLSLPSAERNLSEYEKTLSTLIENSRDIMNHSLTVPAVLQTLEYTAAIIRNYHHRDDALELARQRRLRLEEIFLDPQRKIRLTFPQTALYMPVGSPKVMLAQVERLMNFAPSKSIEFRLLPSDVFVEVPAHYFFTIVDGMYAMSENLLGTASEDDPKKIKRLSENFEELWKVGVQGRDLHLRLQGVREYYSERVRRGA